MATTATVIEREKNECYSYKCDIPPPYYFVLKFMIFTYIAYFTCLDN